MLQSGDIPLLWMRSQAMAAGLQLEPADVMWKIDDLEKEITPSLNLGWWLLELLPLRRLLYCNSDKKTSLPHLGGPRRILPGQKVHVSALFKNNYKPYAKFHGSSEKWPDPMFWNDPNSHLRLQNLSDSWEKDVFDDCSIQTLLADLVQPPVRGQANLDVLDRLAFMANFDVCKHAINAVTGSEETLAAFLRNSNKLVRLSAAVTYCELGWNWPPAMHHSLSDNITGDIAGMLESRDSRENRRACVSLPSLCKQKDLRTRLVNDKNLRIIIRLCDSARMAKHEEGSTVAFHSAQALSMVMKYSDLAPTLMKIGAITDIIQALHDKSNPVVVSVLSIIDGLAKHGDARASMKNARIIPTLLKLMKQFDDFVAPAAIRVLCSLLKLIYGKPCFTLECSPLSWICLTSVLTTPSKW
ncbi:hypothetical protein BS17DRAFT_325375 [Gyrodon lividus]|nr:hypothetical protein BS17DRAFT_325375 [Gyrodon lividus]